MASILLAHVSQRDMGKSLSLNSHHLPDSRLLYLGILLLLPMRTRTKCAHTRLDHIEDPATQTPEYHAAQEQGANPTELGGSGGRASFWFCGHGADHPPLLAHPAPSPAHCMQGLVLSRPVPPCTWCRRPPKMVKRRSMPLEGLLLNPPSPFRPE